MADEKDNPQPGRPNGNGDPSPKRPGRDPNNNLKFSRSMLAWLVILSVGILVLLAMHHGGATTVPYSTFRAELGHNNVAKASVDGDGRIAFKLKGRLAGEPANSPLSMVTYRPKRTLDGFGFQQLMRNFHAHGVTIYSSPSSSHLFWTLFDDFAPLIVVVVIIYVLFFRHLRSAGGGIGMLGNFGRSRHRLLSKEHTNITFNDVAGIDEAKEELTEIVEFLRNPKRFQKLGGRIPRGVLLIGAPGVGKTLLAKAIAGEADVPFFSISGSDFVEMFVGVGASRVRDLFKTAKESSPCIVFLDEIDAVGRRRGNGFSSGGHDEREQTLNAILVEMDGFDTNDQVIVIAATNRSDVLDPALTRPGRFDRQVTVPLPDIKGRYEILKVHAKKVKLAADVDLLKLARQTPMFSGADLAAVINEAALIATMLNKDAVEMADMEEARDKIRFGKARKSRAMDENDRILTAWHEAGHAVIQFFSPDADPLHKVTIIPRGPFGGATFSLPEKDRYYLSQRHLLAELRILFGGRVAEELYMNEVDSGAGMDIRQATSIAREMVCSYGMSQALGPIRFSQDEEQGWMPRTREYSEKTAELIDSEVQRLIKTAHQEATQMLIDKKTELANLKDALLKYESLDLEDVKRIMSGQALAKPTVGDLLAAEQQRRASEVRTESAPAGPGVGPLPQPG